MGTGCCCRGHQMKPIATTLQGARSTFSIFTNIPTPRAETTSLSIRDLAHKTCCCILKWQKQSRGEFAGTAIIGSRTEGLFFFICACNQRVPYWQRMSPMWLEREGKVKVVVFLCFSIFFSGTHMSMKLIGQRLVHSLCFNTKCATYDVEHGCKRLGIRLAHLKC